MTPILGQLSLLGAWLAFAVLALTGLTAVLVWAVRTRQFADQDRARRLPLDSGIPLDAGAPGGSPDAATTGSEEGSGHAAP